MGMLDGKVALVTGGGGGIGRVLCLALARAGASVVVNDLGASLAGEGRSSSPADDTVAAVLEAGGKAVASTHSVTDWDGAQGMVQTALDTFGRLDYVVNNAGALRDGLFHKMTPEDWKLVLDVHINGSFLVSRAAADQFRKQESGAYVFMSSSAALVGNLGQANYVAAKMAMVGLSRSIALDMRRFGVRSNVVAPYAWTRMTSSIPSQTEEQKARVARFQKLTPETNTPLIVYLGSDAAKDVTGQIFCIRRNEIFLFSNTRMMRSVHRAEGWTPEDIQSHAMPAFTPSLEPLITAGQLFTWDPI